MGIYDRDYYRDGTRDSGWLTGLAPVCKGLIIANVVVFVLQHLAPELEQGLVLSVSTVLEQGQVWRLVTAAFCHAGFWHILWNMLFLWWFGRELEHMYGSREFLALYLAAAGFSSLCFVVAAWLQHKTSFMLGASGAVLAVVTLYTLFYPRQRMCFLVGLLIPVTLEMRWWLLIYLAGDLIPLLQQLRGQDPGTMVAHASHLGGALFALLYKTAGLPILGLFRRRWVRPRLRVIQPEPPAPAARRALDELLELQVDLVLEKISREGRASLTPEEEAILERASRQLRSQRQ